MDLLLPQLKSSAWDPSFPPLQKVVGSHVKPSGSKKFVIPCSQGFRPILRFATLVLCRQMSSCSIHKTNPTGLSSLGGFSSPAFQSTKTRSESHFLTKGPDACQKLQSKYTSEDVDCSNDQSNWNPSINVYQQWLKSSEVH